MFVQGLKKNNFCIQESKGKIYITIRVNKYFPFNFKLLNAIVIFV